MPEARYETERSFDIFNMMYKIADFEQEISVDSIEKACLYATGEPLTSIELEKQLELIKIVREKQDASSNSD